MPHSSLFTPLALGALHLDHRVVMAPLTRMRASQPGNVPTALNAEYYAQRATKGGLLIAEATQISQIGQGYPATPGIHSDEQVAGWKLVTDVVHAKGGKIVLQLWHVGRVSHSSLHPDEGLPVAPSPIAPEGKTLTAAWEQVLYETPRALEASEIPGLIQSYVEATHRARAAGFDGVEIHSANGYLLDQFLQDGSNHRTDQFGGSITNRARLTLAVTDAVIGAWDAGHVGIRLSPFGTFGSMSDSDTQGLFTYVIGALAERKLAYLHLIEPRATGAGGSDAVAEAPEVVAMFRPVYPGQIIAAGGFTPQSAAAEVSRTGGAEVVAFGRIFISNPDLVERIRAGAPLNAYNRATFYGGGAVGYTDYPALEGVLF